MKKHVIDHPGSFGDIAERTIRLKTWGIAVDTVQNANRLRELWLSYVSALKREKRFYYYMEACKLNVTVLNNWIVFTLNSEASIWELRAIYRKTGIQQVEDLAREKFMVLPLIELPLDMEEMGEEQRLTIAGVTPPPLDRFKQPTMYEV